MVHQECGGANVQTASHLHQLTVVAFKVNIKVKLSILIKITFDTFLK